MEEAGTCILTQPERLEAAKRDISKRHSKEVRFRWFCVVTAASSVAILAILLVSIAVEGVGQLNWNFLTGHVKGTAEESGFLPAIMGSVWLLVLTAIFALPLGVMAAIAIEEFPPKHPLLRKLRAFIQMNISNLAGVPSVVYGIIGLSVFAYMFGIFGSLGDPIAEIGVTYADQYFNESGKSIRVPVESGTAESPMLVQGMTAYDYKGRELSLNIVPKDADWPTDEKLTASSVREGSTAGRKETKSWYYFQIPFGRGILAGALTLMLVILPVIIIATQEALRAIPSTLRDGARGLGATRWQTVRKITLPAATPGIMTGSILAMSRAIGEAAPLLMLSGIVYITSTPSNLSSDFTAMPLQIYDWAGLPDEEWHAIAASGIIVLLAVLLVFNGIAIFIRQKLQKPLS